MVKNLKKAILLGLLMYIIMFFIASIVMVILGREMIGKVMVCLNPILSILIAAWYLKKYPGLNEGLKLGIIWVILSIILDILVLVYGFKNGWIYFSSWTVWVGYGEVIVFSAIVGKLAVKKQINPIS